MGKLLGNPSPSSGQLHGLNSVPVVPTIGEKLQSGFRRESLSSTPGKGLDDSGTAPELEWELQGSPW